MDKVPTAFRAVDAGELLPTLRQLQRRHPDSVMKWFERGRLWEAHATVMPGFRGYEGRTTRVIPMILLERT